MDVSSEPLSRVLGLLPCFKFEVDCLQLVVCEDHLDWERLRVLSPCEVRVQLDVSLSESYFGLVLSHVFVEKSLSHIIDTDKGACGECLIVKVDDNVFIVHEHISRQELISELDNFRSC